jgi:hypothetical protein
MFYVVGIIFGGKHIPYMYIEDKKKFIAEMHLNTLAPLVRGSLQTAARVQPTVEARAESCPVCSCPQLSKSFICRFVFIHHLIRSKNTKAESF